MNKKIFIDPLIDNNPISRQVLGICSALAVTVKLEQALVMTLALTFVVTMSNVIISMLRNYIPSSIRIIVQLTVISTLVTLIDKALAAYMYDLSKSLSVFIALIVTNCIVMGRADGFAMQNNIKDSFMDGLGNGLGYGVMLILVAFFRELFGFGTVFDYRVLPETFNNGLMILAPGAFIILGLIIWAQRSMTSFVEE
jgi:Na+-transporting NADH:ubiquinone oxidoreductase subunit D|tara:strand:- start:2254 stop:2844 length:591 start_codon:yes stop_codon:yes gene_type:complete